MEKESTQEQPVLVRRELNDDEMYLFHLPPSYSTVRVQSETAFSDEEEFKRT